jgi:chemotaxis protein histidine kinase CheA
MIQFFAMEAGGYLERLDALVSGPGQPQREEFVRLARGLRGSALMANQRSIANAVAGLEHLAKAIGEGRVPWDPATKQLSIRAVDDLKILVRNISNWSDAEEAMAAALAQELDRASARSAARPSVASSETGTRVFISRQGAALANVLERAAQTVGTAPSQPEPLQAVLKAIQPLRGIAGLGDYPPLPDLLEGLERGIAELGKHPELSNQAGELLRAAAAAISRAAKETESSGKPDPDSEEARSFAHLLGSVLGAEPDVVPIESLYYSDSGPHILHRGLAPGMPPQFTKLELVSHGEHLVQLAEQLERAESQTQRELRAQGLMATLKALSSAAGGEFAGAVGEFARVVRSLVGRRFGSEEWVMFARAVREAGSVLSLAAREAETALAQRIREVTTKLLQLGTVAAAPAGAAVSPLPQAKGPAEVPATGIPKSAPQQPVAVLADVSDSSLAASYSHYEELLAAAGSQAPTSLDGLLGMTQEPISGESSRLVAPAAGEEPVVPITELCYSGAAAFERALSLRSQVEAALAKVPSHGVGRELNDLIQEIFDLVELGVGRKG